MEIWKPVVWYEWLYEISNLGRVKSVRWWKSKILKNWYSREYTKINLYNKKKRLYCLIHRLVAQAFIPNPENKPFVCHKDETLTNWLLNNSADNLWWWSNSDNQLDCWEKWRKSSILLCPMKGKFGWNHNTSKKVVQYDKLLNYIWEFSSISEAFIHTKINVSNISKCCKWKAKSAWWFIWKYKWTS